MTKCQHAQLRLEKLEDRLAPTLDLTGVVWRTIDGTNNNPLNARQGAAETVQIRFGYGAEFTDADVNDVGDVLVGPTTTPSRPNPRTLSNAIHAQGRSVVSDRNLTDWVFQWGQFITHDMDLTRNGPQWDVLSTGGPGDFRIPIEDPTDPLGPNPIPFNRSEFVGRRRDQINSITSYIDASMVYGSDSVRAAALRTFQGGRLKTTANGQLLPLNTPGLPNADPFGLGAQLFLTGDVRANEQTGLTVTHTLFVREHNRLAGRIADLYRHLNDEQIYQLARRIVGAEMQAITYEEYLPAVMGYDLAPRPQDAAYDPAVDASITNSFAHATFRFGHSQISERTLLVNNRGERVGSLSIRDAFFNPNFLRSNPGNVERVLLGLASQEGQEVDLLLVDGIRNNLFGPPGAGGLDLAALDIQRGRDHGLPDYNQLRDAYDLPEVTSFAEISSDPAIQAKLQQLFGNVDNIDAFVGALAEDHLPGASVGPLIHAIVGNQFERLRDGDRFFYATDALLQSGDVRRVIDLDRVALSQVIRWNTGIDTIQDNVFFDKSVLIFEARDAGANVRLTAADGSVRLTDVRTGRDIARLSLRDVTQVILIGSVAAPDFFNLFLADARGGLENGVVVYGGTSAGDVMNVYGTQGRDRFTVGPTAVTVNGNDIRYFGVERIRVVKLGGDDAVLIDPTVEPDVDEVNWWDPRNER